MRIMPWVIPYRGTRGLDAFGFGGYGSPRAHKGQNVTHKGTDMIALPGDQVVAPATGLYSHSGPVYSHTPHLLSVHIRGTGEFYPYTFVLFYVQPRPGLMLDMTVKQGEVIGTAQNVAQYWYDRVRTIDEEWARRIVRNDGRMTNHVHGEVRMPDGMPQNPGAYLMTTGRA